jgi:hypothetical protein
MPEFEKDEFKFPDESAEQPAEAEKFEVEIEDDTPPADRGRTPMPKPLVEELEADELDKYDESVKVKLKQMRKVWHDERREKEAALREHNEAITFAKQVLDENKRIKAILQQGEKAYVSTAQDAATMAMEVAKRKYREAYDSGDSDKIVEAQQEMQEASIRMHNARNFRLPPLQPEQNEVQIPQQTQQPVQPQAPAPDDKAMAWQRKNKWFGTNRSMTALALGIHEELSDDGVPVGSEEYYTALDSTMRKRFPEAFEGEKPTTRTAASAVVAPATRSTSSNKIKLKASQVQLAKKLGLTPEQYAKEVLKLEARNG